MNHYHQITPLQAYHPLLRLDTLPFIVIYISLILLDNLPTSLSILSGSASLILTLQKLNTILIFPLVLFLHLSLFLWTRWSVHIETVVGYKKYKVNTAGNIHKAFQSWTHCLVVPPSMTNAIRSNENISNDIYKKKKQNTRIVTAGSVGRMEIVPVSIKPSNISKSNGWVASISYEEMVFRCCLSKNDKNNGNSNDSDYEYQFGKDVEMDGIWKCVSKDGDKKSTVTAPTPQIIDRENNKDNSNSSNTNSTTSIFYRLYYPIDLPLSFYIHQWKGHLTKESITQTKNVYSTNNIHINLPPFIDLLSQQLLAPFFLFQLLCVLLWCLDEYWYYAIFTLFTLILFECTVAHTRLRNLLRLRQTLRMPFHIWTYRCQKWKLVTTNDLIVGDVISLSSSSTSYNGMVGDGSGGATNDHHGVHIPADLLLMKGSAVVNEAMLTGESIPQMKESIDVVASALGGSGCNDNGSSSSASDRLPLDIDDSSYKRALLFGGTVLVNHSSLSITDDEENDRDNENSTKSTKSSSSREISKSPDNGCIAMVLRTGFDTQQGSLLRTMVHTSTKAQSDGVNTKDTFLFILILLLCAVFSSTIVLQHGWNDPKRNRFKLILHVIIIITSVVPPELPMELSLAVTSSLADLIKRCAVYCTEPFRIPLAGMVDTCAFDKTGTLTSDEMVLRGVRLPITDSGGKLSISNDLVLPQKASIDGENDDNVTDEPIPPNILRVMVGCHSLASLSGYNANASVATENLIGDPLEKAVLDGCGWSLLSNSTVAPPQALLSSPKSLGMITIQHRFAFTSKLKRMTVIATDMGSQRTFALTKGAPETLKNFFDPSSIPSIYDSVSRHHMSRGQRVLAMGYKELSNKIAVSAWKKRGRDIIEENLIFAGFLVLDCPLKPDSRKVIKELRSSDHNVVMITGDAVLTAAEVARQVGIIKNSTKAQTFELREIKRSNPNDPTKFEFVPIMANENGDANENRIAYSASNLNVVKSMLDASEIAAICVSGDVLTKLAIETVRQKSLDEGQENTNFDIKTILLHPDAQITLQKLVPLVSVFARHAPRQKEAVIAAFNGAGRYTLMCGELRLHISRTINCYISCF